LAQIREREEKERKERIAEEEALIAKEKFDSDLDRNIARLAEETERLARLVIQCSSLNLTMNTESRKKKRQRRSAIP
jgi:hypothetical protein